MSSAKPTREQADLADVLELLLDKGIVINADIAVTVGDTELLGIELRAAIASFETAAEYGLAFPSGTDMRRVEQASGREPLEGDREPVDLGIDASSGGDGEEQASRRTTGPRPPPGVRSGGGSADDQSDSAAADEEGDDGEGETTGGESDDGDRTDDADGESE